jgi:HAMP domain-containing protein
LALDRFFAVIAALAAFVAVAALIRARRLSRRVERLSESYWELRYEHGQLSARIARLEAGGEREVSVLAQGVPLPPGTAAFVPLSSLKKM